MYLRIYSSIIYLELLELVIFLFPHFDFQLLVGKGYVSIIFIPSSSTVNSVDAQIQIKGHSTGNVVNGIVIVSEGDRR